jgi:hypothetical protein
MEGFCFQTDAAGDHTPPALRIPRYLGPSLNETYCGRWLAACCRAHPPDCRCCNPGPKSRGRAEQSARPRLRASHFPFACSPTPAATGKTGFGLSEFGFSDLPPSFLFRACCREWLRHHVEKKRSVVGSKQRLARDVLGPRLRVNAVREKNDRRSLEVRRPSFGRTPKRRSGPAPAKARFYMHVSGRAEPRRQAARDAAHPHSKMSRSSLEPASASPSKAGRHPQWSQRGNCRKRIHRA